MILHIAVYDLLCHSEPRESLYSDSLGFQNQGKVFSLLRRSNETIFPALRSLAGHPRGKCICRDKWFFTLRINQTPCGLR